MARFDNLLVTTHVYELSEAERACPSCGQQRKEIGTDESWQVEYIPGRFERLQHVRKKYACATCERQGESPQITAAMKPETAIDKGLAGPGLLAYIVTSKFSDYLPLYRLEDVFQRQGFEISRGTQSVWCGDVADLVKPLYELMAERLRTSHVIATDDTILPMLGKGKTAKARMWVYVGDASQPYNVFDFTLDRSRDGPTRFLRDYDQVLLADAYGGYNGVVAGNRITRAGCWAHLRRRFIDAEKTSPTIAREAVKRVRALYRIERQAQNVTTEERFAQRRKEVCPAAGGIAATLAELEGATAAPASDGRSHPVCPEPMERTDGVLGGSIMPLCWMKYHKPLMDARPFAVGRAPVRTGSGLRLLQSATASSVRRVLLG